MLAQWEVRRPAAGIGCNGRDVCKCAERRTPPLNFRYWPDCPERLRRSPAWQGVIATQNMSQVGPLCGWPDSYVAWRVEAAFALWREMDKLRAEQLEAASKAPPGKPTVGGHSGGKPRLPRPGRPPGAPRR